MILDPVYRLFPSLLMARRNLSRTKLRSLLAALGILIGVVAIASLGMAGVALQYSITNEIGDIGNQVQVSPSWENEDYDEIEERDLRQIEQIAGPNAQVTPMKRGFETVEYGPDDASSETIRSAPTGSDLFVATEGEMPERLRSGVMVGSRLAEEHDVGAGDTIVVNGTTMRVRAVVEAESDSSFLDPSGDIVVPDRYFDQNGYDTVYVTAESGHAANETAQRINESLNGREQRVQVTSYDDFTESIDAVFNLINAFLIGIASISLIVAGISILNVMLMSTVERREEIGVLRAVGFQKRDVLKMMLSESAALGLLGGALGVGLSIGVGLAINHYIVGDPLALFRLPNFFYLGLAFAFGLGTSVLSGLYPAWKAASEEPVEALRS